MYFFDLLDIIKRDQRLNFEYGIENFLTSFFYSNFFNVCILILFADHTKGSDDLMKVQLSYISDNECTDIFKSDMGGRQMPDGLIPNMLCAGEMGGGKDTCQVIFPSAFLYSFISEKKEGFS